MLEVPLDGFEWPGPVVWWNPVDGFRHAFDAGQRTRPGQNRETLCGSNVVLIDPSELDWLLPTCDICMSAAVERGRTKEERLAETRRRLRERFGRSGEVF
ncbi:hypothetical protein FHR84_004188 [Actinopolyspora biskrensis]|uniref:Zinc-finger n=1 Tax=Actinopolyspora biskrensis TaxID=1470178 RepID=A0A852Z3T5_9ACTN|nr:zinc finger protein [Actinopolyspora biskrensis]NYH80820.1 hypothetical protein [Actinopolyspora biskrensis]